MTIHSAFIGAFEALGSVLGSRHMSTRQRIKVEFGSDLSEEWVERLYRDALLYCKDLCEASKANPHTPFRRHEPEYYIDEVICQSGFKQYIFERYPQLDPNL